MKIENKLYSILFYSVYILSCHQCNVNRACPVNMNRACPVRIVSANMSRHYASETTPLLKRNRHVFKHYMSSLLTRHDHVCMESILNSRSNYILLPGLNVLNVFY